MTTPIQARNNNLLNTLNIQLNQLQTKWNGRAVRANNNKNKLHFFLIEDVKMITIGIFSGQLMAIAGCKFCDMYMDEKNSLRAYTWLIACVICFTSSVTTSVLNTLYVNMFIRDLKRL